MNLKNIRRGFFVMDKNVSLIVVFVSLFFLIRCLWLGYKRLPYVDDVTGFVIEKKKERPDLQVGDKDVQFAKRYAEAIWGLTRMLFSFWIWDFSKMVYDQESFREIISFMKNNKP